jgi:hypothetical protein
MIMNSYYKRSVNVLNKLNTIIPRQSLGKHLATALDEHQIENLNDKEMFNILNDYLIELESDIPHCEDLEEILKQGMNLNFEDLIEEE